MYILCGLYQHHKYVFLAPPAYQTVVFIYMRMICFPTTMILVVLGGWVFTPHPSSAFKEEDVYTQYKDNIFRVRSKIMMLK